MDGDVPPEGIRPGLPLEAGASLRRRGAGGDAEQGRPHAPGSRDRAVPGHRLQAWAVPGAGAEPALPGVVGRGPAGRLRRSDCLAAPGQACGTSGGGRIGKDRRRVRRRASGSGGRGLDAVREPGAGRPDTANHLRLPQHARLAVRRRPRPPRGELRGGPGSVRERGRRARSRAANMPGAAAELPRL